MIGGTCYFASDVDRRIAKVLGWNDGDTTGWLPQKVASMRGLYDEIMPKKGKPRLNISAHPTDTEIREIANTLKSFRERRSVEMAERVKSGSKYAAECWDTLRYEYSLEERTNRINYMSQLFSEELDRLTNNGVVDRELCANGYRNSKGFYVGGPLFILNSVYNRVAALRQEAWEEKNKVDADPEVAFLEAHNSGKLNFYGAPDYNTDEDFEGELQKYVTWVDHRYEELTKMLTLWDELIPFALKRLTMTEGLKVGKNKEFATSTSSEDYDENNLADTFEISEAKRDGWHENNDLQSGFGSMGRVVRRIISTTPRIKYVPKKERKIDENGFEKVVIAGYTPVPEVDDIGNPLFMDPVTVHQRLQEFLKGIRNADDMIDRLMLGDDPDKYGRSKITWMQPVLDILLNNPQCKTQFYNDFRKVFQQYSVMIEDYKKSQGPIRKWITKVINKANNILNTKYSWRMSATGKHSASSVLYEKVFFDSTGDGGAFKKGVPQKINWKRLAELRRLVTEWTQDRIDPTTKKRTLPPLLFAPEGTTRIVTEYESVEEYDPNTGGTRTVIQKVEKEVPVTMSSKRNFLMDVLNSLGIDADVDTVESILVSKDIYTLRAQLEQLFDVGTSTRGLIHVLSGSVLDSFKTLSIKSSTKAAKDKALRYLEGLEGDTYRALYNQTAGKSVPIKEHTEKILEIVNSHSSGRRVESRARYMGNTMFSFVNPSFLGDRLETIESYVIKDDKEGLLRFLSESYLSCSYFATAEYINGITPRDGNKGGYNATDVEGKGILNSWLAEIVRACFDDTTKLMDSVAGIFTFERDLGSADKKFEDFTTKEHALDMVVHFFADGETGKGYGGKGPKDIAKKSTALYPVFVLGDAGVNKYIRGPRISTPIGYDEDGKVTDDPAKIERVEYVFDEAAEDRILDAFWNIYLQERHRMGIDKAITTQFYANGKKVNRNPEEFTYLTFLNPSSPDYSADYAIAEGQEYDEAIVKSKIRKYLNDAAVSPTGIEHIQKVDARTTRKVTTPSFMQRLQNLGVLDTVKVGKKERFRSIDSIATPGENGTIRNKVREFFWNTKLATVQQLQLMTIDPIFYMDTKDLQKRYKEIHAPGTSLDVAAVDIWSPDGVTLFSSDGMETCVYFNELKVNAEEFNPEFMEAVLRTYALPNIEKSEIDKAIAEGVLIPKTNDEEEGKRIFRLKSLLGSKYDLYDTYTKNALTDGQGFRTLTSYRKVMGMAGKWTDDMEVAYKEIMKIRQKHAIKEGGKIVGYSQCTDKEIQKIARFALVLQPIKPYMFTHEVMYVDVEARDIHNQPILDASGRPKKVQVKKLIPVQHKYAEAVIIPELMPEGHKLRDLGFWMDEKGVDLVGSDKIVKVGCYGQANLEGVQTRDDLYARLNSPKTKIHKLPYKDYRIQTNVPEHINVSRLFGTQIRKLIMAGIRLDNYIYEDYLGVKYINLQTNDSGANSRVPLTGRNLLALFNGLICANIMDSYSAFEENTANIEKLSEVLQQCTIGSMREAMDNLFSYVVTGNEEDLKKFMIPLYEGGLEHDAAALILSTFKKMVNKQQISGGSAVQVSAFGIHGYREDGDLRYVTDPDNKSNVLYVEIEMPFDKSYVVDVKQVDGTVKKVEVQLPFEKYCNPDGTLIPTEEAIPKKGPGGKTNPEWKKYQSYTYKRVDGKLVPCHYQDPAAEVHKPLIEAEYPNILHLIAYRIPTERDYSMINCRVKRFTPKLAGGTLKVPPQGTSVAGFDFDIDKLYFMVRSYHKHFHQEYYIEKSFSPEDVEEIWKRFYKDMYDVESALRSQRAIAEDEGRASYTVTPWGGRKSNTRLHSYWEEARIEEIFGISKEEAFRMTAQTYGFTPDRKRVEGDLIEWFEEYDFNAPPEDSRRNTRAARNNLLIDLMQARLEDPETMKQRYTPGGSTNSSKAARVMRELDHGVLSSDVVTIQDGKVVAVKLDAIEKRQDKNKDPEPKYDPTDPYTILLYNQQNQVAGKLIGIFANHNTNHAFSSLMDEFALIEPIAFCGETHGDLLHKDNPDFAYQVDMNMAELLAAAVDAVKDPVLNFLNLNTVTADAGALLIRLGFTHEDVGLLFKQPIIMELCERAMEKGVRATTILSNLRREYQAAAKRERNSRTEKRNIPRKELAINILNARLTEESGKTRQDYIKENAAEQLEVLDLFEKILKASQDISDFVLNTKFTAANAVSSTLGGLYAQQLKVNEYLSRFPKDPDDPEDVGSLSYRMTITKAIPRSADGSQEAIDRISTPINNDESILPTGRISRNYIEEYIKRFRFNPFAFEQAMYDTNRMCLKLLSKYFPYETAAYVNSRYRLGELALYGNLSEDEINAIHSSIPVAMLARQKGSYFDGEARHGDTKYTHRQYYREHFAEDLMNAIGRDSKLATLPIFDFISPVESVVKVIDPETHAEKEEVIWRLSILDVGGMGVDVKEAIRESWAFMVEVDENGEYKNKVAAKLARDLFMYCFYQMGFDYSPISFMHLAPTAVKDNIVVGRSYSLPIKTWDGSEGEGITAIKKKKPSNDILVWSGLDSYIDGFDSGSRLHKNKLHNNGYYIPKTLELEDVKKLIATAKSRSEFKFKISRDLTPEELALFRYDTCGMDVPPNIYFTNATIRNADSETLENISYGKDRTYRQFLNDILDGNVDISDFNVDQFAKMFILNNLEDSRFVLDIYKTDSMVPKIIEDAVLAEAGLSATSKDSKELEEAGDKLTDLKNGRVAQFTLDVSRYMTDGRYDTALKKLIMRTVSDSKGEIVRREWVGCIKVGNSYFMPACEGGFNINTSDRITFVKVEPWGGKHTIRFDDNKSVPPSMRYTTSTDITPSILPGEEAPDNTTPSGGTSPEPPTAGGPSGSAGGGTGGSTGGSGTFTYSSFTEYMRELEAVNLALMKGHQRKYARAGINVSVEAMAELDVIKRNQTLSHAELHALAEDIRKACKDGDDVLMLDKDGNLTTGC